MRGLLEKVALLVGMGLIAVLVAPPAGATPQDIQNDRFGVALKAPRGWTEIPTKVDEQWIVAKYLSDKIYRYNTEQGWTREFQPEMTVLAFVKAEDGDRGAFKDYEDYLDKTYRSGGFYVSDRAGKKAGKVEATALEITVEKLADAPKYLITWVYHLDDMDVAVQFEVLQDSWKKLKSTANRSFKSFETIERKEDAELPDQDRRGSWISMSDLTSGTPSERRKARMEYELAHREKARAALPDDWTADQIGSCFVLNHTDDRYAKKLVEQVEAVMGWLDDSFPFVGPDEYVRQPILRICASRDEEYSFREGGDGSWGTGIEIVTCRDRNDWTDWEVGWVNSQVFRLWFQDRSFPLYLALPSWIKAGISEQLQNARAKGRKLDFRQDDWDRDRLRQIYREGRQHSPRNLMQMTQEDFYDDWENRRQACALVDFLLSGKSSKTKEVLGDYMRNVQAVVEEIELGEDAESLAKEKPKTEAEEDALYKKRRNLWKDRERRVLEMAYDRTFGSWSDRDWEKFEKTYFDSID